MAALKYYDTVTGTWKIAPTGAQGPAGPGDVDGPASATDNAITRFDGTTGKLIQATTDASIADTGALKLGPTETTPSDTTSRLLITDIDGYLSDVTMSTYNQGYPIINLISSGGTPTTPADRNTNSLAGSIRFKARTGGAITTKASITATSDGYISITPNGTTINLNSATNSTFINGEVVPTVSSTNTLTNKRIRPRFTHIGNPGTHTPDIDTQDGISLLQSSALTVNAPTGTPTDGQKYLLRIKDNGTARAITWNAIYRPIGVTLPTSTVINKTVYIGMVYNSLDTKWDVLSIAQEA